MRGHGSGSAIRLSRGALAFRIVHAAIAVEQLLAIAAVGLVLLLVRSRREDR